MDNKPSPPSPLTPKETLNIIHEIFELVECHGQFSKNMRTFLIHAEEKILTSAWAPPYEGKKIVHSKTRRVESSQTNPDDFSTRLQSTWLGQVYTSYLKQYPVIRWGVTRLWRYGYPFYVNHITTRLSGRKLKRWRGLTPLSEFAKKPGITADKIADAELVNISEPKVFPTCDQSYLISPDNRYTFPEIFVATIKNATTYGGTNLILADDEVVCHDLYDFKRDYTSEELHGRTLIDPKLRRIRWLLHDNTPVQIPIAATFVDACAANYAHWMTEVLPRVVLFCSKEQFKSVPIVVNDKLHTNIMESLFLLVGPDREIITLPIGRALVADTLYVTSVAGYVPFERRTNKLLDHSHGMFSPRPFNLLHNQMNEWGKNTKDYVSPEKIFLRRNSGTRQVTNTIGLEKVLVDRGYVIVEPERLTFYQQTQLFKNAKEIVALTGAALANAIFCQPGTHVTILMGKHEDMIYRYWLNMLAPLQIKVFYVLGDIVKHHNLGIHGDFFVNPSDLLQLLEVFENK